MAILLPLSEIPPRWGVPLLTAAALAAPALRTFSLYFPEGPTYSTEGFTCPLSAEPLVLTDVGLLIEVNWRTISAELNGWPTAVMALGLCAVLALRGSDGCTDTIRFGGWDIILYGPMPHYVAGAVLVTFLALTLREERAGA